MKRDRMAIFALPLLWLFLLTATGAWGEPFTVTLPLDRIARDFSPLTGYVVDQTGEEYVIDLDASRGISVGDVFTISSKGKELVHPVTGKVLGRLEKVKAVLSVTAMEKGYSFAGLLPGSDEPGKGDVIRRYGKIRTLFWDYTGGGRDLHRRMISAMPHMKWVDYASSQRVRPDRPGPPKGKYAGSLVFILREDLLEVRDPDFQVIHAYEVTGAPAGESRQVPAERPIQRARTPGRAQGKESISGKAVTYKEPFPELRTLAALPGPTLMADFVDTDSGKLLAVTNGEKITVFVVDKDGLEQVCAYTPEHPCRILTVAWLRPDPSGFLYLALNKWNAPGLYGDLLVLKQEKLESFQTEIPRLLGTFDQDGDGMPETLLAQEVDTDEIFGHRKWEGRIQNGGLSWSAPAVDFPRNFNVTGSCLADMVGDGKPETVFILNGRLYIYSGQKALFKSSVRVGGSSSVLVYDMDTSPQNRMSNSAVFEIRPRVSDLDGDGRNELIVAAAGADGPGRVSPGIAGEGRSVLSVFTYRNGRFVHGTLGETVSGHVQGLDVSADRVWMVVSREASIFKQGGKSAVVFFELKQP